MRINKLRTFYNEILAHNNTKNIKSESAFIGFRNKIKTNGKIRFVLTSKYRLIPKDILYNKHKYKQITLSKLDDVILSLKNTQRHLIENISKVDYKFKKETYKNNMHKLTDNITKNEILKSLLTQKLYLDKCDGELNRLYDLFLKKFNMKIDNMFDIKNTRRKNRYYNHLMKMITDKILNRPKEKRLISLFNSMFREVLISKGDQIEIKFNEL